MGLIVLITLINYKLLLVQTFNFNFLKSFKKLNSSVLSPSNLNGLKKILTKRILMKK